MSKVTINYDTETYSMDVSVDGKQISDIGGINVYSEEKKDGAKEYYFNIYTSKKENDVWINTTYYVQSQLRLDNPDISSIAGFYGYTTINAKESLLKLFSKIC